MFKSSVIHIPHSSMYIPNFKEYNDVAILDYNMFLLTDHFTDELFSVKQNNVQSIIFNTNRFYCDVERFFDNDKEVMSKVGHGVAYTHTCDGLLLREKPNMDYVKQLYDNHHNTIKQSINNSIENYKDCLIIDAHSFPSNPLPMDLDKTSKRTDFCIGFNEDNSKPSDDSISYIIKYLTTLGFSVSINKPYSGSIFYPEYKDKNVKSIMIEVNRKLYINEQTYNKTENFNFIKNVLKNLISNIII